MAQRRKPTKAKSKSTRSKSTAKRKTSTRSRKRKTASRKKATPKIPLFISALLLSLLVSFLLLSLKTSILLGIVNYYCVKPEPRDQGIEVLYNSVNEYYRAARNENLKPKFWGFLTDRVYWYKPPIKDKHQIGFRGIEYDCFCFTDYPRYDESNTISHDYQISFNGFYKYENPKEALIMMESGSASVEGARVSMLKPFESYEGKKLGFINFLFRYFYPSTCVILFLVFVFADRIPRATMERLLEYILKKII